jgi:hypothetical protein
MRFQLSILYCDYCFVIGTNVQNRCVRIVSFYGQLLDLTLLILFVIYCVILEITFDCYAKTTVTVLPVLFEDLSFENFQRSPVPN